MQVYPGVFESNARRYIVFNNPEQIAFPPQIMTFEIEILARCFAFLLPQLLLLLLYPAQFGNGKYADSVEIHPQRRRDAHPSCGRINAQVDVLDVLLHHLGDDFTQVDPRDHQYSFCCSMMRNMRSTSATFCKTPYKASLTTCSRG